MALNKRKKEQAERTLSGILDAQDGDVLVVRKKEKDCEILFTNTSARDRLNVEGLNAQSCKRGYSRAFPYLCEHCPNFDTAEPGPPSGFDVEAADGRTFAVAANGIEWMDEKGAVALALRDVTEERAARQKMYNLAYIDQLTGVPNRQKYREDFEAVRREIESNQLCGIVAIFDLDNFKAINDTYGHNAGDAMLKLLTGHLENSAAFKGHLYRLGGDEFILFFADKMGTYKTREEFRNHYVEILYGAFLSYTMPSIERSCTLSMGLAYFPEHGASYSELLRKADIALYNAKESGRNQLVVFEDQYDMAEKFKDIYINIQPILKQSQGTYGYEMIDRGGEEGEREGELSLSEFDRTMDALGLNEIGNDARYFIGFSKQLLNATVIKNLPKDKFVIQVRASAQCSEKEMTVYRTLRAYGYSLALTGLAPASANCALLELVDYCKFEPGSMSGDRQAAIIKDNPKKMFIATGVNSARDFENARRQGFKLFQGYFFEQPVETKKTKDIDPLKINYFRLLKLTSTDDFVDFQEIASIISSDVALSYKLLKLLNSAAVGLRYQVSSITMAVAYLGEDNLKQWIALLALRGVASDRPIELVRMSLIRARFGELLAPHFIPRKDAKHVFLVGLLSLLHIALEKPKEELLDEIPVVEDIRESLLTKNGIYSDLLTFFSDYEYSNWDAITNFAREGRLSPQLINDSYVAAVKWTNELVET